MIGAVEMILGVRDLFVWAGEAHAQGLALLELALVLRLVRVRAELAELLPKYSGGGSCVPLGCHKPRLASMGSARATLTLHSPSEEDASVMPLGCHKPRLASMGIMGSARATLTLHSPSEEDASVIWLGQCDSGIPCAVANPSKLRLYAPQSSEPSPVNTGTQCINVTPTP